MMSADVPSNFIDNAKVMSNSGEKELIMPPFYFQETLRSS